MILIFSSCTARKDDSLPIDRDAPIITPPDYLSDQELISTLREKRASIFQDERAKMGSRITYAYDLYVRTGRAYKELFANNYREMKEALKKKQGIEWFFLSGGFGIIHALEGAWSYQASFNYAIAHKEDIPFTAKLWGASLPAICDLVISRFSPDCTYVFGSRDYTSFVMRTNAWKQNANIKVIESTGSAGPLWISERIGTLVDAFLGGNLQKIDRDFCRFNKQ